MAKCYTPAVRGDATAIASCAGAAIAAAAIAAVAAYGVARGAALVLALPAAQGLAVGIAARWAIRRRCLQRPGAAGAVAAAAAAFAVIGHGALDYADARGERRAKCGEIRTIQQYSGVDPADELDYDACVGALDVQTFFALRFGLRGDPASSGRASWVVGAIELALAMALAGLLAAAAAREPACPTCGAWRVESALGRAAIGATRPFVDAMLAGDADAAAALLKPPDTREEIALSLLACPAGHDDGGGVMRVIERTLDRRRQLRSRRIADLATDRREVDAIRARTAETA